MGGTPTGGQGRIGAQRQLCQLKPTEPAFPEPHAELQAASAENRVLPSPVIAHMTPVMGLRVVGFLNFRVLELSRALRSLSQPPLSRKGRFHAEEIAEHRD